MNLTASYKASTTSKATTLVSSSAGTKCLLLKEQHMGAFAATVDYVTNFLLGPFCQKKKLQGSGTILRCVWYNFMV
jgi:hypothetical protein